MVRVWLGVNLKRHGVDCGRTVGGVGQQSLGVPEFSGLYSAAYSEYLNPKSMEEMRERVAGMPDATSRDWLKDDDEGETMIKTLSAIAIAGAAIATSMPTAGA